MRRMFSKKQIDELSASIGQALINVGAVRKIAAPSSTTLTDEELENIAKGVFIVGSFLGYTNPVLFPCFETENDYRGLLMSSMEITSYQINKSTKVISVASQTTRRIYVKSLGYLNGKQVPNYPSDTGTFTLKCVDGVLTWVEDV